MFEPAFDFNAPQYPCLMAATDGYSISADRAEGKRKLDIADLFTLGD